DPPEGKGLDQGAVARVAEELAEQTLILVVAPTKRNSTLTDASQTWTDGPLLPPPAASRLRTYLGVGITTRGRTGQVSKRVTVPLLPPPPPAPRPNVTYRETTVAVKSAQG